MTSQTMDFTRLKRSNFLHLCFAITFFTSGLIINLIQCILYLTLRPFNKRLYRQINYYLCYSLYTEMVFMGEWWANVEVYLYIDREEYDKYYGKEHNYCVMNHSYEIDWLVGWILCDRINCLGNAKAYCKKAIQYMPVLGWAWKFSEFVFLERSYDKDKEIIGRQITELADHPDPIWLLLFPEGTRFTEQKHEASQKFAKEKGLPELKYHLTPRTKGFVASLPNMRGKVPALLDIELAFKPTDKVEPTMTNLLFGKTVAAHMYMKRIPLEQVPEDDEGASKFLQDMFQTKDKLRESFVNTGDFFATSGVKRLEPFQVPRRLFSLLNIIFWSVSILIPMWYYLFKLLFSGELVYFSVGVGIITLFFLLLNKTIGMSKISKGSSYGTDDTKKVQ